MLYGEDAVKNLESARVMIFGIGGVGSFVAEAIARAGVGEIVVVDKDAVSVSNINRQLVALNSTVGQSKAEVMARRIKDINPKAKVISVQEFFNENTLNTFNFANTNYIIDAIDTIKCKILLIQTAKKLNIPIISALSAGNKINATELKVEDIFNTSVCPIAKTLRTELKKLNITSLKTVYSKEAPKKVAPITENGKRIPSSGSVVPAVMGLIIAGEVINNLAHNAQRTAHNEGII